MRLSRALLLLTPLGFAGCLNGTDTQAVPRIPIDCETLATSLTASEPSLTTTTSGLKYRDVTVGTGITVAVGKGVSVHYSGCLTTGLKFDESSNIDQPYIFIVGGTQRPIAGFDEGVIGMKVGGRRQLVIPPSLGYGATANGPIPANSTLVFTVDAIDAQP
jgi:FKBP-type peptidyl-prolyl cis-trans isomerase